MKIAKPLHFFYILLFFYAYPFLSFFYEFTGLPGNALSVVLRAVTLCIALIILGYNWKKRINYTTLDFWIFLLFWIIYTPRIIYDTTFHPEFLGSAPINYYLFGPVISCICVLPFFNKVPIDEAKLERKIYIFTILLCIMGFMYALSSERFFVDRVKGNARLNELSFALIAVTLIVISIKRLLQYKETLVKRLGAVASFILGLLCLLLSGSKNPMIFLSLFLLMFLGKRMTKSPFKTTLLLVLIAGSLTYVILRYDLSFIFDVFFSRLESLGKDTSSIERKRALAGAWSQFLESPLFGSFVEEKTTREYPHNMVLESFMAIGIFGGILFIFIYLRFFARVVRFVIRSNFAILPIIALMQFILSITSGSLGFDPDFWACFAIMAVYQKQGRPSESLDTKTLVNG